MENKKYLWTLILGFFALFNFIFCLQFLNVNLYGILAGMNLMTFLVSIPLFFILNKFKKEQE